MGDEQGWAFASEAKRVRCAVDEEDVWTNLAARMHEPGMAFCTQRNYPTGTLACQADCKSMVDLVCGQACCNLGGNADVLVHFEGMCGCLLDNFEVAVVDDVTGSPYSGR